MPSPRSNSPVHEKNEGGRVWGTQLLYMHTFTDIYFVLDHSPLHERNRAGSRTQDFETEEAIRLWQLIKHVPPEYVSREGDDYNSPDIVSMSLSHWHLARWHKLTHMNLEGLSPHHHLPYSPPHHHLPPGSGTENCCYDYNCCTYQSASLARRKLHTQLVMQKDAFSRGKVPTWKMVQKGSYQECGVLLNSSGHIYLVNLTMTDTSSKVPRYLRIGDQLSLYAETDDEGLDGFISTLGYVKHCLYNIYCFTT